MKYYFENDQRDNGADGLNWHIDASNTNSNNPNKTLEIIKALPVFNVVELPLHVDLNFQKTMQQFSTTNIQLNISNNTPQPQTFEITAKNDLESQSAQQRLIISGPLKHQVIVAPQSNSTAEFTACALECGMAILPSIRIKHDDRILFESQDTHAIFVESIAKSFKS